MAFYGQKVKFLGGWLAALTTRLGEAVEGYRDEFGEGGMYMQAAVDIIHSAAACHGIIPFHDSPPVMDSV